MKSMMNSFQMSEAMKNLNEWKLVGSFSVGGFEYMGFSNIDSNKLIIISSQRETIFDCEDGSITDIDVIFDEKEFVAVTEVLPDECIQIAGTYGGQMPHKTLQGERVEVSYHDKHIVSGKELQLQQIVFVDRFGTEKIIYDNYPSYVCGFSYDGNSFALADDGGVYILRRINN